MPKLATGLMVTVAGGRHVLPALALPNANDRVMVRLKRCTAITPLLWPNAATRVTITVEESSDGGQTWQFFLGATAVGGVVRNRDGIESTETTLSGMVPPGLNRKVRAFFDVENGPLVTEVDVEAT